MDKLTAMATFVKVVDAGSFTRAADALGLPKARVSQRVSDLEKHLGVRLLNRTTRALSLTHDGSAYFDKCQVLLQQIDELEATLRGGTATPIGRLRVDSLITIARWVIAPRLHAFQARYPRIQLRLSSSDRISNLLEDGIDCTIRGGALKDSSMIARHLCDIQMGLYASPEYLASIGGVDSPDDLSQFRRLSWFSGRERNPFMWELESGPERFVVQSGDGMQFDEPDVAISACVAGSGICPGAPFAVAGFVRAGKLVPVLPQWHFSAAPVHVIYPGSRHLSVRVRCFVNWVMELFAENPEIQLTPIALALESGLAQRT
ncbi:TPA: LysR family transcriptional regulator [Pseudomonas aeruginosa]|uniref:LysR substrate-binding domain-containing protein n=1 Tax=Pseudomonas aeruginosa TaxID=287 RepID=UPI00053D3813|nr:LysR family transcriptional regulator [Pseudomonas aeruginosa]MCV0140819.1 LysR family transcriptional regulator [Pseudomonas aeruginosa]HBO5303156.1 LysR family transcriptional regulator [Pseudomonas aeruginosa]HBP1336220.1 LysR family transcriptional regulator [Pseudomonas aeruginosa]HBP5663697.1 LysR family transcriptional regulator [Pseudomonas aeruginosa]HCF5914396.1 LysR family transcriptional regulator [Pseudomonas aeruginosa]